MPCTCPCTQTNSPARRERVRVRVRKSRPRGADRHVDPDDCLYETATLVWMVVLGFLCRQGFRNGMDAVRNTGLWPANLPALSGQRRWPEGRPVTAPCTPTLTRLLDTLAPVMLEAVLVATVRTLIRGKVFDDTRLYFGAWVTNVPIHSSSGKASEHGSGAAAACARPP